jgi:hypothetical protein
MKGLLPVLGKVERPIMADVRSCPTQRPMKTYE